MIAYCTVDCCECPIYAATLTNDNMLRGDIARQLTGNFNYALEPGQINCGGCKGSKNVFFFCKLCEVKKCAITKGLDNCSLCPDYACENLKDLMKISCFDIFKKKYQSL